MAFNLLHSMHWKCKGKDREGWIGKNGGKEMREESGHNPIANFL